jgi:hypothetical protein
MSVILRSLGAEFLLTVGWDFAGDWEGSAAGTRRGPKEAVAGVLRRSPRRVSDARLLVDIINPFPIDVSTLLPSGEELNAAG